MSINTVHVPNWKYLTFKDRKLVIDESKGRGIIYRGKGGAKYGERGNSNHAAADSNSFKQLKEQNQKYKRNSKALKISNNSKYDNDKEQLDAGDQSGGKSLKKTRFNTSTLFCRQLHKLIVEMD